MSVFYMKFNNMFRIPGYSPQTTTLTIKTTTEKTETAVTEPTNILPNSTTTEEQPETEQTFKPNPETEGTIGWTEYTGTTLDTTDEFTEESRNTQTPETTDYFTNETESYGTDKTTIEIEPTDYTLPSNSTEPDTTDNIWTTTEEDMPTESTTEEATPEPTTPKPEVCPNDEPIVNIPYPGNCTLYFLCIMGKEMGIFSCPSGLLFHTEKRKCELEDLAVCTVEYFWN
jgi:hypothetical protein